MVLNKQSRVYLLGLVCAGLILSGCSDSESSRSAAGGSSIVSSDMVTSFGDNGFVAYDVGADKSGFIKDIALDAQDALYAVGTIDDDNLYTEDLLLLKFDRDGQLDTQYGNGGVVIADNAAGGAGFDRAAGVVIDTTNTLDNAIVVGSSASIDNDYKLVAWRFDKYGDLNGSFGTDGVLVDPLNMPKAFADQVLLDENRTLYVLGRLYDWFHTKPYIWKFNMNGEIDSSFGGSGLVQDDYDLSEYGKIIIDNQKNILFAGTEITDNGSNVVLLRFKPNGELDATFGNEGRVINNRLFQECGQGMKLVSSIGVTSEDKIVITGEVCENSQANMILMQFDANGTADTAFGNNGFVKGSSSGEEWGSDLVIDADDNIIVVGKRFTGEGNNMVIWKYDAQGVPVSTFGRSGEIVDAHYAPGCSSSGQGVAVVLDSAGDIVVGGVSSNNMPVFWKFHNR